MEEEEEFGAANSKHEVNEAQFKSLDQLVIDKELI
jgi:hypothetical protein